MTSLATDRRGMGDRKVVVREYGLLIEPEVRLLMQVARAWRR